MTHLPFIAASYGLAAVLVVAYAANAAVRLGQARRRLAALDPRTAAGQGTP
ncbi:MAG: hypothetical protein ACRYGC_03855 [Janthinobacterium lividum]